MAEVQIKSQMPASVNAQMKGKEIREQRTKLNALRAKMMVGRAQAKANRPKPRLAN